MIQRFIEVLPKKLFRGSAPSPNDIKILKEKFNINKIISLDQQSANRVSRACKLLDMQHIVLPINLDTLKPDLLKFFQHNLKKLLIDGGPTFVHCYAGKDRTGLVIALFKVKYMGMDPEDAIEEAESLGFGVGVNDEVTNLFKKLIRNAKPVKNKEEFSTIVSNEREYIGDNRDSFLDESRQGSFAPYLAPTRQYPMDALYVYINDQSPTRENYKSINPNISQEEDIIPQVGVFNNDAGARGFGPTENYSGFFYD
jgi:protein tyrosine/serine phosphatase